VIAPLVHLEAKVAQPEPPRGDLAGGIWFAPPWVIGVLGVVIALGAVAAVVLRAVIARRKQDEKSPRSRRRW
jgi:hypothetical protein